MADKKHILTYAGLKQYEDELQNLKVVKRKEVAHPRTASVRHMSKCVSYLPFFYFLPFAIYL